MTFRPLLVLAGALSLAAAVPASAQSGRHVPADVRAEAIPAELGNGLLTATFSHRQEKGDAAVWVRVVNDGERVLGVYKQRLREGHRRGRDRFLVQPGTEVWARYERQDFDVTLSCAEGMVPGLPCGGSVTMVPVRRGEPGPGSLGEIEIYSGSPMPAGASCMDAPVQLPLVHVKYGDARLHAEVMHQGSSETGCNTFEVTANGAVIAKDYAGGEGGMGTQWFQGVEDADLMVRCSGSGGGMGGCQGTVRLTLTP